MTPDSEMQRIVEEEEKCLARVLAHAEHLRTRKPEVPVFNEHTDYDVQLLALRDEIATARLEDVPPLIEQMERLQGLASRRREVAQGFVDARSPYFGRLVLEEAGRRREVLIGRSTYLDTGSSLRIVDWRDAPVSRLFYRYEEGDDYVEVFGEREVEGVVVVRRSLVIIEGQLRRIACPQGQFARQRDGGWRRLQAATTQLYGGQGSAARAEQHHRLGQLGVGDGAGASDDKHLREITALIDRRQFELITSPDSGLVVIQGGAGSGKTTIGLHRLAYLAFQDPQRFRPDKVLVVVFNDALARYISQVLPALEINGVAIRTYESWASRVRETHLPGLPKRYHPDTPVGVTRLKKHPAMLKAIDALVDAMTQRVEGEVERLGSTYLEPAHCATLVGAWRSTAGRPLAQRFYALPERARRALDLPLDVRVGIERIARDGVRHARDVVGRFAELVTDSASLGAAFASHGSTAMSVGDLERAVAWCSARASELVQYLENDETDGAERGRGGEQRGSERSSGKRESRIGSRKDVNREWTEIGRERHEDDDVELELRHGVDGAAIEADAMLDREDDTLLLRLHQRLVGPLMRGTKGKEPLVYEHVFVDEAQDLSPVELAVVLDTVSKAKSVTLAGDVAQRLYMDNGFTDWNGVLGELGFEHVEIEPLRISYRSTAPIIDFAKAVLGPLAPKEQGQAIRDGAPVELFGFGHTGDAVGFLAERLRDLLHSEPRCSVAVITRYPEQADMYYEGLRKGDVPYLRRIAEQDFPFKPGVDVTDARQVKGLEFDYVILAEITGSSFPRDDEARHLLHIAATRAAHQLWVLSSGTPSELLPKELLERSL